MQNYNLNSAAELNVIHGEKLVKLIILMSIFISMASCTAVVRSPVPINEKTKVGIISFVGDTAKNRVWGVTAFGNAYLPKNVDWDINGYLNKKITDKVNFYGMNALVINNVKDIHGLKGETLDGLSRLRPEIITAMDALKVKYGVDIIIIAKEYNRGEGNSALFTEGYGVTKFPNETFIHTNITLYSIEIEYRNFFMPAKLDGYTFEGFARRSTDSRVNLIDSNSNSVVLDSATESRVKANIDSLVNWYFSGYPVIKK